MTVVPDLAEPVAGWRVWRVLHEPDGPVLVSPARPQVWPHRCPMAAMCVMGCEKSPSLRCGCGLYATDGIDRLPLAHHATTVLGCVGLWGEVIEHDSGWRGELAYPLVLLVLAAAPADVVPGKRRFYRVRSPSPHESSIVHEDADAVRALSSELARVYGVPVHPAQALFDADLPGGVRPGRVAVDTVRAEAVNGLVGRRAGDPEARARLDDRVSDLIGSARG